MFFFLPSSEFASGQKTKTNRRVCDYLLASCQQHMYSMHSGIPRGWLQRKSWRPHISALS